MATIKIVSINKRNVTVDVKWQNGYQRTFVVPNMPVESLAETQAAMTVYIASMYEGVCREEAQKAYDNPTIDPSIIATVGKTFNEDGSVVS